MDLMLNLAKDLGIDPVSFKLLTQMEYATIRDHLDRITFEVQADGSYKKRTTKTWMQLRRAVAAANLRKGVGEKRQKQIKEFLGIRKGSMKFATERQMRQYLEIIEPARDVPPTVTRDSVIGESMAAKLLDHNLSSLKTKMGNSIGNIISSADVMVRKYAGNKVADLMLEHFQLESNL